MMAYPANRQSGWYLVTTWLLVMLFASCKCECEEDKNFYWALYQQLEQSSQLHASEAFRQSKELAEKLNEPETLYRAEIWQPNLAFIETQIQGALALADSLQEALLISQGLSKKLDKDAFLKNKDVIASVNDAGRLVASRLKEVENNILERVPKIEKDLAHAEFWVSLFNDAPFSKIPTRHISVARAVTDFNVVRNKLWLVQAHSSVYCNANVHDSGDYFTSYSIIVGQNASVLRPGQKLEISAGLGAFSSETNPEIYIYNKKQPLLSEGFANYIGLAPQKSGKYNIPVTITFENSSGTRDTVKRNVRFEVVDY